MFEALFKYSREDYARSELVYAADWPEWVLLLLAIAGIAGFAVFLYRRRMLAEPWQLVMIGVLQVAMLALVLWLLQQPTLRTEQLRAGENAVALVLDSSGSMAYGAEEQRISAAIRGLAAVAEVDDSLNLAFRYYELGENAFAVDSFADSAATREATSIAGSLVSVLREARFNPLAAVVLASDGADTGGGLTPDVLADIAAFGVPVHTIAVGREQIVEDVEIAEVSVPAKVIPGSTVSARIAIRHDGAAQTQLKVYDGDNLLALQDVELAADSAVTNAWIDVDLPEAGHHQLQFSVDPVGDEKELRNNTKSALVEVAAQTYRVLYFEGEPRWEYKFLRRAVANDEDLSLVSLLRVSPNKFYRQGIANPEQLEDGFPLTRDELFTYDALIIGSVEAALLEPAQQSMIADFVSERGGSLLMLAGPSGLGNGGWGQSDLADVLPAALPPTGRSSFFRKRAIAELTPQGADVEMLQLDGEADLNREAWAALPEVADYQLLGELKPAAVTLLEARTDTGRQPLLVTQPYGRGHSYILATGGTWRWQMSMPLEDQSHETFWRQTLRALVADTPDNVALTANAGSDNVALRAEFRDDAFEPIDDIGVTVVASHADGASWSIELQPSQNEAGIYVADFVPDASGTWYFEALAQRNEEPVATSRASIHFETGQAEHFNIRRNSTLLRNLAAATGGEFLETSELDRLPDLLRYSSSGITEQQLRAIWDAPAFLLLLILLKAGEWLLRRRWSTI